MRYVYLIRNSINNKVYIGQTAHLYKRWRCHYSSGSAASDEKYPLYISMRKYGNENFTYEVLCKVETDDEADEEEIFWIDFYKSHDRLHGYNLDLGGKGAKRMAQSTIDKIVAARQETYRLNPELKKNHGRPQTEEMNRRQSENSKGIDRLTSEQHKEIGKAVSAYRTGKKMAEETKEKIRKTLTGTKRDPAIVFRMKKKMSQAKAKEVKNDISLKVLTHKEIADKYDISVTMIESIIAGHTYKDK